MKKIMRLFSRFECISIFFMIFIFALSGITFFNAIIAYLGISSNPKIISSAIFLLLDIILLFNFINTLYLNKNFKLIFVFITINIIYISPYILDFDYLELIKYCMFILPYSAIGITMAVSDKTRNKFFRYANVIAPIIAICALIYIDTLSFAVDDKLYDYMKILTYGNIAWFFLLFYFITVINFVSGKYTGRKAIWLLYIAILEVAICYTGLRTGLISIFFSIFIALLSRVAKDKAEKRYIVKRFMALTLLSTVFVFVSYNTIPASSRAGYIGSIIKSEIIDNNDNINHEKQIENNQLMELSFPEGEVYVNSSKLIVLDVKARSYTTIERLFQKYIFESKESDITVITKLHNDIISGKGEYILVKEENQEYASEYEPHRNRSYLWNAALNEWKKQLYTGNGIRHFQQKYIGTFPHNVVLELLSDYGIIGLAISGVLFFILIFSSVKNELKKITANTMESLIFTLCFIPGFLLYTSLYSNGPLLFMMVFLISTFCLNREKKSLKIISLKF